MTQVDQDLPDDLRAALGQAQLQYKAVELSSIQDLRRDGDFLRFVPKPAATESWAVGGRIVFSIRDGDEAISGEVAEYNSDDGSIYVDVPNIEALSDLSRFKIRYEPFDYSGALIGAFDRLRSHPQLLGTALQRVCGVRFETNKTSQDPLLKPRAASPEPESIPQYWDAPWFILWGPPGTGKTYNVAHALAFHASTSSSGKVLVVTPTNLAADEVALRLCDLLAGRKALTHEGYCVVYRGGRGVGAPLSKKYPECLRDKSYAELYDSTKRQIAELEAAQEAARRRKESGKAAEAQKQINALRSTLPDETDFAVMGGKARVVVLTTFKAFKYAGQGDSPSIFSKVILDEAGMISRVTAAALSTLGRSVLLAGDPRQIGPVFTRPRGLSKDVNKWLLESALGHLSSPRELSPDANVHFLNTQFRMHPHISAAVSSFTYDGALQDSPKSMSLGTEAPLAKILPTGRAAYLVLDEAASRPEDTCARKASVGTGYERALSAHIAMTLANATSEEADGVLILTPYRAQVRVLRNLARETAPSKKISIGTIHRNQGTEKDVVILDLVRAALSWSDPEIATLINVALSRAKRHFVLIASRAELATPVLHRLASLLAREEIKPELLGGECKQQLLSFAAASDALPTPLAPPLLGQTTTLGEEIGGLARRLPLFSADQMRLSERNIGEGHYLVRGVAGSGKSVILAHWATRLIQRRPQFKILVSFYNTGMYGLARSMIKAACVRLGVDPAVADKRITLVHAARVDASQTYDAVFVDEAQDIEPDDLRKLYYSCRVHTDGNARKLRNFVLFSDDSQNVYGRQSLEELKESLPEEFAFNGRSFVLRETYRSTQSILSFAINLALDPKKVYSAEEPGLLQFMKVAELSKEGLLIRPEESEDGFYHVRYTERTGVEPRVRVCGNSSEILSRLTREIQDLIGREGVRPGDIMVVAPTRPIRMQDALRRSGVPAIAYGGTGGQLPIGMPAGDSDHVRCTTVFTCKGHEAPVVFFVNMHEIDTAERFMPEKSPQELKRIKRCMLYVGTSRAMIRLYVFGEASPSMSAAQEYSKVEIPPPGLL